MVDGMVTVYRCPDTRKDGRCEMHSLVPVILSPPFKTLSVLHSCEWHHLHIVFTISCNRLIPFECLAHLHSAISWPLVASSSEQLLYFPSLTLGPFRPKSPLLVSVSVMAHGSCECQWMSTPVFGQVDTLRLPSVRVLVSKAVHWCAEDSSEMAKVKWKREKPYSLK